MVILRFFGVVVGEGVVRLDPKEKVWAAARADIGRLIRVFRSNRLNSSCDDSSSGKRRIYTRVLCDGFH